MRRTAIPGFGESVAPLPRVCSTATARSSRSLRAYWAPNGIVRFCSRCSRRSEPMRRYSAMWTNCGGEDPLPVFPSGQRGLPTSVCCLAARRPLLRPPLELNPDFRRAANELRNERIGDNPYLSSLSVHPVGRHQLRHQRQISLHADNLDKACIGNGKGAVTIERVDLADKSAPIG